MHSATSQGERAAVRGRRRSIRGILGAGVAHDARFERRTDLAVAVRVIAVDAVVDIHVGVSRVSLNICIGLSVLVLCDVGFHVDPVGLGIGIAIRIDISPGIAVGVYVVGDTFLRVGVRIRRRFGQRIAVGVYVVGGIGVRYGVSLAVIALIALVRMKLREIDPRHAPGHSHCRHESGDHRSCQNHSVAPTMAPRSAVGATPTATGGGDSPPKSVKKNSVSAVTAAAPAIASRAVVAFASVSMSE